MRVEDLGSYDSRLAQGLATMQLIEVAMRPKSGRKTAGLSVIRLSD
jgi:hypothetical protein